MEVTCDQCKTKLNIPDEKIPKDQMVRVNCPKCKSKITIEPHKAAEEKPSHPDPHSETGKLHLKFIESQRPDETEEKGYSYDDYSDDEALDFFDEDTKLVLIMSDNNEHSEKIKTTVEELGYKTIYAPNTRDALGKMRFHHFDLIFLSDGFDGQGLENSPILNYVNHISMSSRRRIFLALMGEQFKTMDDMMAFSMSANAVINSRDLEKLPSVLDKGISEYEKFYKVFMDTLVELGRA
ncbi:MAG: zinc-ribbon domain-containing protein [Deltaproteobacteria bacterium]|nr:zinc-ribbon domain-containing protein [Deltaproteobacteria bacterium]